MRGCEIGFAKASFVILYIGFRRRLSIPPGKRHQVVPAGTAKRLDHIEMVTARAVERFRKGIGISPDPVDLLCQQIDGFDQAGITAETEQDLMEAEIAVEDGQQI